MERIPHRDLRNRSSEILRRVEAGEAFEITNHGKVVAVLRQPSESEGWRARLSRPATKTRSWRNVTRITADRSTEDVLDDLRDDRR